MYLSLINEGQISGVKEQLPELISKYPNNPDIMFLKGVMTTDGNKSICLIKSFSLTSNFLSYLPRDKSKLIPFRMD